MFQPLQGVKIIDLTYFVAGPGATKMLADWGADVIKVEPPFGDPGRTTGATMSCPIEEDCNPWYSAYNYNKRGLSLNLKTDEGKGILKKLLQTANVFVSSYRTQALKKLGLDYKTLHAEFPHLIWAQVNGYGDFGPAKDNPGFDVVAFWARSGAMMDFIEKDTAPLNAPIAFGDGTTATTFAGGIAGALYAQAKTGKGCKVMISLYNQALWNNGAMVVSSQYGDTYPKSRKNATSPLLDSFQCSDGKWIFICILQHERFYPVLMRDVLNRPDLADDPRFNTAAASKKHAPELIAILSEEFAKYPRDEMAKRLSDADIAYDMMQHVKDTLTDPQALENKYIMPIKNLDGTETKTAMTPVRFAESEPVSIEDVAPVFRCQAPKVGQDSIAILKECGYTDQEIQSYIQDGIVVSHN